jgi:hypothetical protein
LDGDLILENSTFKKIIIEKNKASKKLF